MESSKYSKMARYYDTIYSSIVDYKSQSDYLERVFARHSKRVGSILDLACGTGNYTFMFAKRGYKATGIDSSREMIEIARKKLGSKKNPKFFLMDMRNMNLKDSFDAATVLFGGFGYLTRVSDLKKFFSSVKKVLDRNGLLIFEFWQSSGVLPETATPTGRKNYDVSGKDNTLIVRLHQSNFDSQKDILQILFQHYVIEMKKKKLIDSFSETHVVRTYSVREMTRLLGQNGFKKLAFYAGGVGKMKKLETVKESTFRVLAVARPRES